MSQRTKVVGARTPVIWLLIAISLIVIAALAVGGLVIYPQMQKQQAEQARGAEAEQHYQAGLAFQNVSDWTAAEGEYKQVIILDASHKDTQSRLAEVKAHLAGSTATATAVAIAQAGQAQAQLQATAIAAQATTAAGPTATAAVLEVHYQKGLGYMNMSQWAEAKTELDLVFAVDPNYKEVQAKLTEARNKLSEVALLTPTPTSVPLASPTPKSTSVAVGVIPFSAPGNPQALNPAFGWQPGGSAASAYDLTMNPGALTLISGPEVDHWKSNDSAPLVVYSIRGNFEAQVKLVINSIQDGQWASLGVRSAQIHTTWIHLLRGWQDNAGGQMIWAQLDQEGSAGKLNSTPCTNTTIWLKLERRGSLFTLSYSANGSNWVTLEKDFVFEMPIDTEIYLCAMSGAKGVVAQFYDFKVFPK